MSNTVPCPECSGIDYCRTCGGTGMLCDSGIRVYLGNDGRYLYHNGDLIAKARSLDLLLEEISVLLLTT